MRNVSNDSPFGTEARVRDPHGHQVTCSQEAHVNDCRGWNETCRPHQTLAAMATDAQAAAELAQEHAQEAFQRREWLVQRIGWTLLAACLAAACVGVFGDGPVARQTSGAGEVHVELDRFARRHSPTQWSISVKRTHQIGSHVLRISSSEHGQLF